MCYVRYHNCHSSIDQCVLIPPGEGVLLYAVCGGVGSVLTMDLVGYLSSLAVLLGNGFIMSGK